MNGLPSNLHPVDSQYSNPINPEASQSMNQPQQTSKESRIGGLSRLISVLTSPISHVLTKLSSKIGEWASQFFKSISRPTKTENSISISTEKQNLIDEIKTTKSNILKMKHLLNLNKSPDANDTEKINQAEVEANEHASNEIQSRMKELKRTKEADLKQELYNLKEELSKLDKQFDLLSQKLR